MMKVKFKHSEYSKVTVKLTEKQFNNLSDCYDLLHNDLPEFLNRPEYQTLDRLLAQFHVEGKFDLVTEGNT